MGRDGVFVKGVDDRSYLLEGFVQLWGGGKIGFMGCFHSVLLTKGAVVEIFEEGPFVIVLWAAVNILKMPQPLQVLGVAVVVVVDDLASDIFVVGVGGFIALQGLFNGPLHVSGDDGV